MGGNATPGLFLSGKQVAFTGRLASMSRQEAGELVRTRGGRFVTSLAQKTDYLVVGQEGWPLRADGHLTRKLERARALQQAGHPIEILPEEEFLGRVGLEEERGNVRRLYTGAELCRILEVPLHRLRLWIRSGLITPVKVIHRLSYFEFRQVASARALTDLIRAGVRMERIRRSLKQLENWLPDLEQPLSHLAPAAGKAALLLRLEEGHLVEPDGQMVFDFGEPEEAGGAIPVIEHRPRTAEDWFELALRREDAGQLQEAVKAYLEALRVGKPQAEYCFNLANVLYALNRKEASLERFRQAIELDPEFVEAWNNLGNVLADLGELEEALEAYREALRIEPHYADAHYNLAEALEQVGDAREARVHWRAYLRHGPRDAWAHRARERLRR